MKEFTLNSLIFLFLFITDFLIFSLLHGWYLHSLLVVSLLLLLVTDFYDSFSSLYILPTFLLLLQDVFMYERFGLILLFLLPVGFLAKEVKYIVSRPFSLFFPLLLVLYLFFDHSIINGLLLRYDTSLPMTVGKYFANMVVGLVAFWGLRGNRSFYKERKVWTPNR